MGSVDGRYLTGMSFIHLLVSLTSQFIFERRRYPYTCVAHRAVNFETRRLQNEASFWLSACAQTARSHLAPTQTAVLLSAIDRHFTHFGIKVTYGKCINTTAAGASPQFAFQNTDLHKEGSVLESTLPACKETCRFSYTRNTLKHSHMICEGCFQFNHNRF